LAELLSTSAFYEEGKRGKLKGLECEAGHITVPPRHSCRICQSTNLNVVELSGRGKILACTQVFRKSVEFPLETPYVLAIVVLEEGGNLLGILRAPFEKSVHGAKVRVKFEIVKKTEHLSPERERPRIFFELEE
jgi:uncharacterized OB-fold protein